ncbi:T9SS type A sorting domain-containing protein [Flavobacterium sp.]|uniref:T9SS type A sorting domain-containing protein n=1 Tax=Flavobacterium sp. TaxID=239 RepID=UPI003BBA0520
MKKILLFIFFISLQISFGQVQINTPTDYTVCDANNDGSEIFNLTTKNPEILGNLSPNVYSVSYYISQADAMENINPLPEQYFCWNSMQIIYARVTEINNPSNYSITSFWLHIYSIPIANTITGTFCYNQQCWDLTQFIPSINNDNADPNIYISFYYTSADAQSSTNSIPNPSCVFSPVTTPNINFYYTVTNIVSGCIAFGTINAQIIANCPTVDCLPPTVSIGNPTQNSVTVTCTDAPPNTIYMLEIAVVPFGAPLPTQGTLTMSNNAFTITGLNCSTEYQIFARKACSNSSTGAQNSAWSSPISFGTLICESQFGQPQSFSTCTDTNQVCFNLTDNDDDIIGTMNPIDYTITYHASPNEAEANVNPLPSPYCAGIGNTAIYARVSYNNVPGQYFTTVFYLNVTAFHLSPTPLQQMEQCDDDSNGSIIFNLTSVQSQLNSIDTLQYFTSLQNAEALTNPIANPSAFSVNVQSTIMTIYLREIIANSCDMIYSVNLITFPNCNNASVCSQANSLCSSLGIPFPNTTNLPSTGALGCLNTTPNPTWFVMPISQAGNISLMIQQSTDINFSTNNLDVDYVVFGPYTNPTTPCNGQITSNYVVSCSYSPNNLEYPVITNAQPGQYYLIMVTNFSNSPGYIRITDIGSTSTGSINCSGIRLNAFLDTNNNGTKEVGEQNFPLGQFHYEINTNGITHHITSPTGVYNIYDTNTTNSYNLNYTIDPAYTSLYTLSTSSFNNVSVINGGGMVTYNFPITIVQSYTDLATTIVPFVEPRPGFIYENKIIYTNLGNQNIASGSINFVNDPNVTITSVSQAGATMLANGFSYNFTNLAPFEIRVISVFMQVPTIPTVTMGQLLTSSVTINPIAGDEVPSNNTSNLAQIIINAYDPNDKMESHGGKIIYSSFNSSDYLTYTIRFENTGTASAINVRINDVLDSKLDETTIRTLSSSDSYILDRVGNNLNWKFDNIMLPVSIANTTIGKGYVTFQVKPKPGYALGDIIPNTGSIYFDYNPAIITNTFNTEFVAPLANDEFYSTNLAVYPNPANEIITIQLNSNSFIKQIQVIDMLGRVIKKESYSSSNYSEVMNLKEVGSGTYFVEVTSDSNKKEIKKIIIN